MAPRRHCDASGQPQHGIRRATKFARILQPYGARLPRSAKRSWRVGPAQLLDTTLALLGRVRVRHVRRPPRERTPGVRLQHAAAGEPRALVSLQSPPRRALAGRHLGMADGRLPAVFNDAAFHRVREDRSTLQAAVDAARFGPQQLMVRRLRDAVRSALSARATTCPAGPARRGPRGCASRAGRGAHESEARRTTQDFLVLAGGKSSTQLQSVQELADRLAFAQGAPCAGPRRARAQAHASPPGRGQMCIPIVNAPTKAAGECVCSRARAARQPVC